MLPKAKGLNRFVWDMRYATMPGVPGVYIEGSYDGHKAVPGTYRFTLRMGSQNAATAGRDPRQSAVSRPRAAGYKEYDALMSGWRAT